MILYIIELCIYNIFSLKNQLENNKKINVREFKHCILVSMLESNKKSKEQSKNVEENLSKHMLLNIDNKENENIKKGINRNKKNVFYILNYITSENQFTQDVFIVKFYFVFHAIVSITILTF